ncbi:MAG TPA: adenosine deaminase [Candidatus Limnocylindrales bacterium]|nr:adenosine deaminase [Candidatus Limnocylindrales bacterium]
MQAWPPESADLRALPKAELHQHLDGALRPETAVELATGIGMALSLEEARRRMVAPARCRDQAELLTYFDLPIALLQTATGLRRAATELVEDLAADGVRYAEVRWAPRLHLGDGLSVGEVIEAVAGGVADGTRRAGTSGGDTGSPGAGGPLVVLIVTAMRSHPPGANVILARTAAEFGAPVVGFDLAGPEASYPAPPHAVAFRAAEDGGLALTAHAGEVPGPERIREALALGVRRIAHGPTTADDPALITAVRERDVTLDLCPTSNVQAGIVASLEQHPIGRLHRAGVSVSLSTDDRTVSDTTLSNEMARVVAAQRLTPAEMVAIAVNGFRRGFGPHAFLRTAAADAERDWNVWAGIS